MPMRDCTCGREDCGGSLALRQTSALTSHVQYCTEYPTLESSADRPLGLRLAEDRPLIRH
jgi:hypothetical protein